jgi:hypothetical protein
MGRFRQALAIGTLVFLAATAAGAEAPTNAPLRLAVDLADGSRLVGQPAATPLPFHTSFALMNIPLDRLATLTMAEDRETATVTLRNGDRLQGVLDLKTLEMDTLFGKVSLGIGLLRSLQVRAQARIRGVRPSAPPAQGMILHYGFDTDEGAAVADDRDPEKKGLAAEDATWARDGVRGGSFAFAGNGGYVEAPAPSGLDKATISVWMKLAALPKAVPFAAVSYCQGGQNAMEHDKDIRVMPDGTFAFYIWNGGGGVQVTSATSLTTGVWNHVVGVVDGSKIKIYVDGSGEGEADAGPSWGGGNCFVLSFVKGFGPTHEFFRGSMDELRIYDRALSEEEVQSLYLYDVGE